jgi:hypothetical protein
MSSQCFTPWNVPRVRVTQLDSCGVPVTGDCSQVVSEGIITVELTREYEDRVDLFKKNGDGKFCFKKTIPPILKWINAVMTFCSVDPELVPMLSENPSYLNDADSPVATGYSTEEDGAYTVNFAFEAWTRLGNTGNDTCVSGGEWGYRLYPWMVEGTIGDITLENDSADFVVNARTQAGSPWGVGPYFVDISQATATAGNPIRMVSPIGANQHERIFVSQMAPPEASCGCRSLVGDLTVTPSGGLGVTLTTPTAYVGQQVYISWGDGTTARYASAATSYAKTYAGTGTYTVTMTLLTESSAGYTTSVTV